DDRIELARAARAVQDRRVTIILHKPLGYVSGQAEDGYKPARVLIRPENRWPRDLSPLRFERSQLQNLVPAGRLDINSTGLLTLTQDGRIARRIIGEDSDVEKEYLVRIAGNLSEQGLRLLNPGLSLDGEELLPARVRWANDGQLQFILRQGKKRQIRRMCELVGVHVTPLKRVRVGGVRLGALPLGKWRYLGADEYF
ncbi:MAG: pseudouridine synthase, partial [Pyramidobacter sp.]|nr:pseudouridine synthase [Pyramidobacter sp.]